MLEVISTIIGAYVVSGSSTEFTEVLHHLMRILNIYGHILSNAKPLIVPKQKSKDIFTPSKELAMINSLRFFSSDHFYLKLYLVLKNSFESNRRTINQDAEVKLKHLLHDILKSLQTLLESKVMLTEHMKLLEETVGYLNQLLTFQQQDCIVTTKILLKFFYLKEICQEKK
jgi:hypothetical protein